MTNLKRVLALVLCTIFCASVLWAQQPTKPPQHETQPVPNQEPFTIEGLMLGMPAEALKAHGLKLKHDKFWAAHTEHGTHVWAVSDADTDRAATIRVRYTISTPPFGDPNGVTFETMMNALAEKWGKPVSTDTNSEARHNAFNAQVATTYTEIAVWTRGKQTAILAYRKNVKHFEGVRAPLGEEYPMLYLTVGTGRTASELAEPDVWTDFSLRPPPNLLPPDPGDPAATKEQVKF